MESALVVDVLTREWLSETADGLVVVVVVDGEIG